MVNEILNVMEEDGGLMQEKEKWQECRKRKLKLKCRELSE